MSGLAALSMLPGATWPAALPVLVQDAVIDPIEVLRPTTLSGTDLATIVAGALAGGATVVLLALTVTRRLPASADQDDDRTRRSRSDAVILTALLAAAVATVIELALVVLPGGIGSAALTGRVPATLTARLLLLAALALLLQTRRADPAGQARNLQAATVGLALLANGTVALAAPGLAGTSGLVWRSVVVAVLWVVVAGASWVLHRLRPAQAAVFPAAAVLTLVVALGLGLAAWPDPAPPYHAERIDAGGVLLDLTLAPVEPGRNEFHLYAWDAALREVDLQEVTVAVAAASDLVVDRADPPTGSGAADAPEHGMPLLRVSPNHHLSYMLDLPDADAWTITIHATRADGGSLTAIMLVEEDR